MSKNLAIAIARFNIAIHEMEKAKTMAEKNLATIVQHLPNVMLDERGWLTDEGKEAVRQFYDAGISTNKAGEMIGISGQAVYRYYKRFEQEAA